jgi:Uma2 family endonuclease
MSVVTPLPTSTFSLPPYPVHRFTVDEYHLMVRAGILTEDDPVELLEGWIVPKMPRNPRHDATIDEAQDVLRRHLPAGWRIRGQSAITTNDSEPEPDIAIVRGPAMRYSAAHPSPQDIAALIEVADSSLLRDRRDKGRLYARAGVSYYWILNLTDRQIEVYTDPTGPATNPSYRQRQDYGITASVSLVVDGQEVAQIPVTALVP